MRRLIASTALAVTAFAPAAPAFAAFSLDNYVEKAVYCTNYEDSEEYTGVVDGRTQVIGRDYKGKAYVNFPVTPTGAKTDGMLVNRDRNVKQWEYFYKFLKKWTRCEDSYYGLRFFR